MEEFQAKQVQAVDAEVIEDELMISSASFEIDMSGIQRDVEELTFAIDQALTVYGDVLVEDGAIASMGRSEARECELRLSRAIRTADELRRQLNRDYKVPLDVAKGRYDEIMGPIVALHAAYKQRRLEFEEADRARKLEEIRAVYERIAPQIALPPKEGGAPLVPFERVFEMYGSKWLSKGAGLDAIERKLAEVAAAVDEGERRIEASGLKHTTEAYAVFWRTLDVEKALARDRELCALEEQQAITARRSEKQGEGESAERGKGALASVAFDAAPATVAPTSSNSGRKPRVMLIEGATDDECRQIAALCTSLGIRGVFKGPKFYETVKTWMPQ